MTLLEGYVFIGLPLIVLGMAGLAYWYASTLDSGPRRQRHTPAGE